MSLAESNLSTPALEELLTTKELAKVLNIDDRTPESWRMRGVGPRFIRVGGLPRYRPSDVREYLDANAAVSTSQESARAAGRFAHSPIAA